jgi:hypothetical protein
MDEVVGPERVLLEVPGGDAITGHGESPGDVGLNEVVGLREDVVCLFEEAEEGDAVVEVGGGDVVVLVRRRVLLLDEVL